ncbi:MAG: hypothetical protein ABR540_16490 [Acidimicrobiales bacterium]
MTVTTSQPTPSSQEARAARLYGSLLALYPTSFRDQFGEDMRQTFADLLVHRAGGRPSRVWPRVLFDLVVSASKERAGQLGPRGRWAPAFVAAAALVTVAVTGRGGSSRMFLPLVLLIVLPTFGVVQLRAAWLVRRTTGVLHVARIVVGAVAFVPAVAWLILVGEDRGFWIGITLMLSLICGLGLGAMWAVGTLVTALRQPAEVRSRRRAVIVLATAVVVLGSMAAAGFNSYRNSQPPAGDHSDEHASSESRALWNAAAAGDLGTVTAMIDGCADPFVHFNGLGRARSEAEEEYASWGGRDRWKALGAEGEAKLADFREIAVRLRAAEDTWVQRCQAAPTANAQP